MKKAGLFISLIKSVKLSLLQAISQKSNLFKSRRQFQKSHDISSTEFRMVQWGDLRLQVEVAELNELKGQRLERAKQ